jgi:hypothetical protein
MGIFSKIFGNEKPGEESWRSDPKELKRRALLALTKQMVFFQETVSIATMLGEKPIPKTLEKKRIQVAFAAGVNDFLCLSNEMNIADTVEVFEKFLFQEYGRTEGAKFYSWVAKNQSKVKFLKIMKIAGQSVVDNTKGKLKNKIIFYDTVMDKSNKL